MSLLTARSGLLIPRGDAFRVIRLENAPPIAVTTPASCCWPRLAIVVTDCVAPTARGTRPVTRMMP
jgi:hypothetical protein